MAEKRVYIIDDLIADFGASTTLSGVKTAIQTGLAYTCPKCGGEGRFDQATGSSDIPTVKVTCDICEGRGKTLVEYEAYCTAQGWRPVEGGGGGGL